MPEAGPRLVLIHGSAADHTTWSIQLASPMLRERFELVAYDRGIHRTVEAHAADAAAHVGDGPAIVVGSSFGAVVALELVRSQPVAGAVLIEPPLAPGDDVPAAVAGFLATYDDCARTQGGPAAAELFLRTVLGGPAVDRMPRAYRERAVAKWREIRADSEALIAYRPRYAELAAVTTPVILVGGTRSAPYFAPTLAALAAALPRARRETASAGHMLHAEAHRWFAEVLVGFAAELGLAPG